MQVLFLAVPRARETAFFTSLALIAFAANSILARLALRTGHMDAASFTTVRLVSGALILTLLTRLQSGGWRALSGRGVVGPIALFAYAPTFSFAYVRIGAATGALLLFGAVQLTMVGWGIARGERPRPTVWLGAAIAAAGLFWLTFPSADRPDPIGCALMVVAGISWGAYSLHGRTATDALGSNARSFVLVLPFALLLELIARSHAAVSTRGLAAAMASGAITSGLGYAIWYRALRGLSATQAAFLQLSVPVIAAVAAVLLLHEPANPRLAVSSVAVLGGLALVAARRAR
jgi:drug/metabolite transporter (DMT)-like permease